MGAPLGNRNAANSRMFRDSLGKVLSEYVNKERGIKRGQALYHINKQLVELALDGKEFAIKEVANRTDGKPIQVQEIYSEHTAKSVVGIFRAKLEDDSKVYEMLTVAGADNLLPVLAQLMIEQPLALTHETQENTSG